MTNSLLITGGAGFIGANFVIYWANHYPNDTLVVLDKLNYAGNLTSLNAVKDHKNFVFIQADIGDTECVKRILVEHHTNILINFAAESHVDNSISGPKAFIDTNICGTFSLLEAARQVWLGNATPHRFHHVSTDEVYGSLEPEAPGFTETSPYAPNSPYSASKAASDHLIRAYNKTYGLHVTTSNCSNNYGPFQFPEKLIPLTITRILQNDTIPIYGDGKQIRDWLYVDDHISGLDLILKKGVVGETYNIGGENEITNYELIRQIINVIEDEFAHNPNRSKQFPNAKAVMNKSTEQLISFVTDRPGHDRRYAIDASKAKAELGYRAKESIPTGIKKTIAWFLDHEAWWAPLAKGINT